MTYYEVLNIPQSSSGDVIKAAYKNLAKIYHPDVSCEKNAEEKFKIINEAYRVLSDNELRAEYDEWLDSIKSSKTHIVSTVENKPNTEKASIIHEEDNVNTKHDRKSASGNSFSAIIFVVIVIGVIWFFNKNDTKLEIQSPDSSVSFFLDNCKNFNYKKIQNYADNKEINRFIDDILIKMYDHSLENENSDFLRDLLSSFEYEILNVDYTDDKHSNVTVYISSCDFLTLLKNENSDTIDDWLEIHALECIGKSEEDISQMYLHNIINQRKCLIDGKIVFNLYLDEDGEEWVITSAEDQVLLFNILIGNLGEMYWEIVDELGYEVFE